MINREVYEEKSRFVKDLERVLAKAQLAAAIEYKNLEKQYMEYIRITFLGGSTEYINVTGDSIRSIFVEISRVINRQAAIGSVTDLRMKDMIERWWSEAV